MRIPVSLALLATAALTVACSSPAKSDTEQRGQQSSPAREVNKSLTLTDGSSTALVTLGSVVESYQPSKDSVAEAKSGNFVLVDVKFEGKTGRYSVNSLRVYLRKPDGTVVKSSDGDANYAVEVEEQLDHGEIDAGKVMAGKIAFDAAYDPGATLLVTDTLGRITGRWPLAGGEPAEGDGGAKREINKSVTYKVYGGSAQITVVSVAESKGGLDDNLVPKSGTFVILDLKVAGKSGDIYFSSSDVKLKLPDGKVVDEDEGNGSYAVDSEQDIDGDVVAGETLTGQVGIDAPLQPGTKVVFADSDKVIAELPL